MLRFRNHLACAVAAIWFALLWSGFVVAFALVGTVLLLGAYISTCWALIYLHRQGLELNAFARSAGAFVLALLAFAAWGNVLSVVPAGLPISKYPIWLSFLSFLLPCAAATVTTVALLLVPAPLLLSKHAWFPPVLGCVIAFAVAGWSPSAGSQDAISGAIVTMEWVAFATLPAFILHLLSGKLRAALRAA
jgi:hypothetical protein